MMMLAPLAAAALQAQCQGREGWSDPAPPVRIHGRTYYVGTCGISSILVTSPKGHVLIDAGPKEAAPLIAANIRRLGFRLRDVKLILASHEHHDHVGGMAALQRMTGATVGLSAAAKEVMRTGKVGPDDPQYGLIQGAEPVRSGPPIINGDVMKVGSLRLTAHLTPGHSPGGTSWTWKSCERRHCLTIAYADSLSAVSADGYRFSDHPERIGVLTASFAIVEGLDCDLLLTPHPSASDLFARLAGKAKLVDPKACAAYAARAGQALSKRLDREEAQGSAARSGSR